MSLGITNNNRRSPLETNRSFIFPPSNNKIWTTEPKYLLELQEELQEKVLKKKVFGNITNRNNNANKNTNKIEPFSTINVVMPIHFNMTPEFQVLFIGNDNFWMNNIEQILKNVGLNFLYYDASMHCIRYTYIPNINITSPLENQKIMATCYCHLKALIDDHIYTIIDNKIKCGMVTLEYEYQYATQYLQNHISKNIRKIN